MRALHQRSRVACPDIRDGCGVRPERPARPLTKAITSVRDVYAGE